MIKNNTGPVSTSDAAKGGPIADKVKEGVDKRLGKS